MKICVDIRQLRAKKTGLARYSENVIRHLNQRDTHNEYFLLVHETTPLLELSDNFTEVRVPYGTASTRGFFQTHKFVNHMNLDIYHSLTPIVPIAINSKKIVVTLHDLISVKYPKISSENPLKGWRRSLLGTPFLKRSLKKSDCIIAVSESTKNDAIEHFGLHSKRIVVSHLGVDRIFLESSKVGLPEQCKYHPFIFTLGNSKPYKNLTRFIYAFARISTHKPEIKLIISGRGIDNKNLIRLVGRLNLSDRVVFTGELNDAQVRSCFEHALFLAFPSTVEGFGLPVVEAMASGCPVLTSNTSSLREIAGDDAVCVDPFDIDAIFTGMEKLLNDQTLRSRLCLLGKERSQAFSWCRHVNSIMEVHKKLY